MTIAFGRRIKHASKALKEMLEYGILQVRILQMSTKRFKVTKLSENFVEKRNNQEPQSSK